MKTLNTNIANELLQDIIQEFGKDTITLQRSRILELFSLTLKDGKKYICPLENSGPNDAHIYEYEDGVFGIFTRPETDYEIFEYSDFVSAQEAQEWYAEHKRNLTQKNKEIFETLDMIEIN